MVGPEAIYEQPVDVFAPCALGAVLNDRTIPHLRVRLVCGGANNQLADKQHDAMLAARGIAYVPDYLANAGGVIDFYQEVIDDSPAAVLRLGRADPRHHRARCWPAPPPRARRRCRWPTGSCATASAPQPRGTTWPLAARSWSGCWRRYGVDTVFGIPGVHTVELYRGLPATRIRHVTPRHEQGAGFMADGYARVSGKPGRVLHHHRPRDDQHPDRHGPGLRRFRADAGDLQSVNRTEQLAMGQGRLHELRSQQAVVAGVAAFSHTVLHPSQLPEVLARAFALFASARPRPVHIEIPIDVITAPGDGLPLAPRPLPGPPGAGPRSDRPRGGAAGRGDQRHCW